mgnify:FL=1
MLCASRILSCRTYQKRETLTLYCTVSIIIVVSYLYATFMGAAHLQSLYNSDKSVGERFEEGCLNENAIDRMNVLSLVL